MKLKLSIILLMALACGCSINKPVKYATKDIQSNQNRSFSNIILDIEELTDKRKENPENGILYGNSQIAKLNEVQVCINSERYYKKEPLTSQVSRMLLTHLNKRNSFKMVLLNRKDTADYYIQGNLTRFYGRQNYSTAALAGSQFGLIGALATAGVKSEGKIIFEISDLKIYNKKNELVKYLGTFRKEYDGNFPADEYCWCIYENVNTKLKEYFSELIIVIETEIKTAEQSSYK